MLWRAPGGRGRCALYLSTTNKYIYLSVGSCSPELQGSLQASKAVLCGAVYVASGYPQRRQSLREVLVGYLDRRPAVGKAVCPAGPTAVLTVVLLNFQRFRFDQDTSMHRTGGRGGDRRRVAARLLIDVNQPRPTGGPTAPGRRANTRRLPAIARRRGHPQHFTARCEAIRAIPYMYLHRYRMYW